MALLDAYKMSSVAAVRPPTAIALNRSRIEYPLPFVAIAALPECRDVRSADAGSNVPAVRGGCSTLGNPPRPRQILFVAVVAVAAAVDQREVADVFEGDQRVVPGAGVVVDAFAV